MNSKLLLLNYLDDYKRHDEDKYFLINDVSSLVNTTVTSGQSSWQWNGCRVLPSYHWSYSCSCSALISTRTCEPSFSTPSSSSCHNWSLSYRQLDQLTLRPDGHTNCWHRTRLDAWIPR